MENSNKFKKVSAINNIIITSDEFMKAFNGIQDCAKRSMAYEEPIGSMLLAEGGLGKTTLCKTIESQMPRYEKVEVDYKKTVVPVFYVEVPSQGTVKSLAITMLIELGDQTYTSGTVEYLTNRLIYLLATCETKLIFLDEFHHFFERKTTTIRMNRTTGNWIKTLANKTGISFCLVGLPEFVPLLQVDSQIARRFPFIYKLNPLMIEDSDGYGTLYAFLCEFSRKLSEIKINFSPPLDSPLIGLQIFLATKGYHSYIVNLVRESINQALENGRNTVISDDFNSAWQLGITLFINQINKSPFEMTFPQVLSALSKDKND